MRRIIFAAVLSLGFMALACDNITSPATDPHAPPQEAPQPKPKPETPEEISKDRLIETYNLVVDTRNGMLKWQAKLEPMIQNKDPMLLAGRRAFVDWVSPRTIMLNIRMEWLSPETHKFPKDHPAVSLWLAVRAEKQMMENFVNYFQLQKPLPPNPDAETKQYLDEFSEKMKTWKFQEDEQTQPGVEIKR